MMVLQQEKPFIESMPFNLYTFSAAILDKNSMHRNFLISALRKLTNVEIIHLDLYIEFCLQSGLTMDYLAECYLTIVGDTLREQVYFQKNKKYRHSTFAEVASNVYFNHDYMSCYMYGLAITAFLWPNHLAVLRFFQKTFPKNRSGNYLEVGPGHGYYFMQALEQSAYQKFVGVDISETSIAQARALIEYFFSQSPKNFELVCMDFLQCDLPDAEFDAVVMGEVLEHVECPELFLDQVARISKHDAHIFITTCINAPAVDHIYLFKNTEQLEKLFANCGFRIKDKLICPYEGKSIEECLNQLLAINVAYVLEKNER